MSESILRDKSKDFAKMIVILCRDFSAGFSIIPLTTVGSRDIINFWFVFCVIKRL